MSDPDPEFSSRRRVQPPTSAVFGPTDEHGRRLTHEERIEALIAAAIPDPGHRLFLEQELARGGMGAVRQAFDGVLQRRMAAKTLHERTYEHLVLVHGFLREAQVTGQLDHPNIVPIYELGRDTTGELYFTMKLVEGHSLKAEIRRTGAHDPEALRARLEIFVKVCDALAFAHSRGVLHLDIKSANVMVGGFGQVYLMDWGGAQLLPPPPGADTEHWVRDSLPPLPPDAMQGLVFGTPAYMSPEQASAGREPVDERADVFSMGALLYEIMTGRPPYQAATPHEGLALARAVEIVSPDRLPGPPLLPYPRELVRIVMKALQREPADRYASVGALQADIVRLLRGGGDFSQVRYLRGEHIIREGEVGDAAYIVLTGTLEVYRVVDGKNVHLRDLGPGDMFGETAIFAASPRTASVVATTDVALILVTREVVEQELASMKPWMGAFIRTLASRFGGAAPSAPAAAPPVHAAHPEGPPDVSEQYREETIFADVMSDFDDQSLPGPEAIVGAASTATTGGQNETTEPGASTSPDDTSLILTVRRPRPVGP